MNNFLSKLKILFLVFAALFLLGPQAMAGINGTHAINYACLAGSATNGNPTTHTYHLYAGQCTETQSVYVPHSGKYKVETRVTDRYGVFIASATTTTAQLDETKSIAEQNVTVSGTDVSFNIPSQGDYMFCKNIIDESNNVYVLDTREPGCNGSGAQPLPVTPPVVPTSCKINNGSALTVDLKTIDRSALPTVPGTGSIKHFLVDVECTGGIDVSVSMKLSYTPISVSGTQVIQSSSNGLGVAVIYADKAISTTDATPVTFISGSNTLDLGFQAVRDPAVEVANIPTGAFTASAVLVMTQQ